MKRFRRIGACALGALFVIADAGGPLGRPARADDAFIAAIRSMKRSVTPLICTLPAPSGGFYGPIIDGTAFFISKRGDFLTAAHVIDDFAAGHRFANCPAKVWFQNATAPVGAISVHLSLVSIADCAIDATLDIARCRTIDDLSTVNDGKFEPAPVDIDADQQEDGTAIAITGFPLSNATPITSRGYVGGYQPDARGPVQMVLDRSAWPGGSGSPVYDSRGRIVGMLVQAGAGLASGIAIARSGFALSRFLDAHPPPAK